MKLMLKRFIACSTLAVLVFVITCSAQNTETPDPYKPILDRLASLTVSSVPDWQFHTDVPHPEDPSLKTSDWEPMKLGDKWTNGSRVLRRWIEIPEKINGYSTQGARVQLDLILNCVGTAYISTYSN